ALVCRFKLGFWIVGGGAAEKKLTSELYLSAMACALNTPSWTRRRAMVIEPRKFGVAAPLDSFWLPTRKGNGLPTELSSMSHVFSDVANTLEWAGAPFR